MGYILICYNSTLETEVKKQTLALTLNLSPAVGTCR